MSLRHHIAWIGAAALASTAFSAQMTVNTKVKDGDNISGEHTFVVTVDSDNLVTQVEFYVGEDLRDTDDSTPYEFKIDTLLEKDGPLEVTFAAYTNTGESKKKTVTVNVNNELAKGAGFHIEKAQEALAISNWDAALAAGRVALKIEPENNDARMVMARANFGKGVMDLAQKFAEDVLASDSDNEQALDLMAGISLDRVFRTTLSGAPNLSRTEVVTSVKSALDRAATSRITALQNQITNFGTVTDANRLRYADLLARAGRYSLIIDMFDDIVAADPKNSDAYNWLIYAQLRAGRFKDAGLSMRNYERTGLPDAYGYALKAVLYQYAGQEQASKDAEREAILNDPGSLGVRTGQVYLALRRGDVNTFSKLASDLAASEGNSSISNYYLGTLYYFMQDTGMSQDYMRSAFLSEPALYDLYVERGNQFISFVRLNNITGDEATHQRNMAKAFFEAGLKVKPESFEVLTGLCIVNMLNGQLDEAIKMGRAAVAAGPEYAPAHYALAAAYQRARNPEARAMHAKAETLDSYLRGRPVGTPEDAWNYFYGYGRVPLIALPSVSSGS